MRVAGLPIARCLRRDEATTTSHGCGVYGARERHRRCAGASSTLNRRSGRPGRLPARVPHGSGLVELPHPAPRITDSLRGGTPAPHPQVAICCRFVDTLSSLDVLSMFRSNRSMIRHPLPSAGSCGGQFPCVHGTMGCSDSLPPVPPHFVAFAWRYHACDAAVRVPTFPPLPPAGVTRQAGLGFSCREPLPASGRGDDRVSQVPGEPYCEHAPLHDPGGTARIRPIRHERCCLPWAPRRRLPRS